MTPQQEQQATALMIRAQQGDAIAYAELLTLLAATARHYARNRVGEVPWLDDVAQETLLTVHAARRTYDPRRPFAPWFYAILSSRMIDVLRKERRVQAREMGTDVLPEPAPSPRSASRITARSQLWDRSRCLPEPTASSPADRQDGYEARAGSP